MTQDGASHKTTAKVLDTISRLPGIAREARMYTGEHE